MTRRAVGIGLERVMATSVAAETATAVAAIMGPEMSTAAATLATRCGEEEEAVALSAAAGAASASVDGAEGAVAGDLDLVFLLLYPDMDLLSRLFWGCHLLASPHFLPCRQAADRAAGAALKFIAQSRSCDAYPVLLP